MVAVRQEHDNQSGTELEDLPALYWKFLLQSNCHILLMKHFSSQQAAGGGLFRLTLHSIYYCFIKNLLEIILRDG